MNEQQQQLTLPTAVYTMSALGKVGICTALLSLSSHLPRSATSYSMQPHLPYSFLPSQENLMPNRNNRVHLSKKGGRKIKKLSLTKVQEKAIMATDSVMSTFSTSVL